MPRRLSTFLPALALIAAIAGCSRSAPPAPAPKTPEVGVVTLAPERLALQTELAGRTSAPLVAEIRPQVGGIVQKRPYTEGALVKAGEVLYQLDPSGFQAALASAQAGVRKAEATLAAARVTATRNAELLKIDAVSRQVSDESQAALAQAEADLGVARAAQETARINLGYTRITAPIAGRVGLSTVTQGALVTANQTTALTTVQQLDPIHIDVTQSSTELLKLKREFAQGRLKPAEGGAAARIGLTLEDGSRYAHDGTLAFSGVTVDAGTGTVTLRAVVPNPQGLLMPGMYVRAKLDEGVDANALLVPQQAVTRAADGSASALVVGPDDKLARRKLELGRAVGTRWQVVSGLAAGERVLVDGAQKAKVGDTVRAVAWQGGAARAAASASAPSSAPSSASPSVAAAR